MRVALGQMEVTPGNPEKNLEKMLSMIETAKIAEADLVVFPELCLSGYLLGDKWYDEDFCRDLMEYNEDIRQASEGIAVAYGNIYMEETDGWHPNKDGRARKYNAMYVYENGQAAQRVQETAVLPSGVQPKTLLPNYRIFDDERYFFSTEDVAKDAGVSLESLLQPFIINDTPVGFEICEDLWCKDYRKNNKPINPTDTLIKNGAELIMNGSASPWTYGKNGARDRRITFLKEESGDAFVPFCYVNNVGAQNNGKNILVFDGGSTVYNAEGEPIVFAQQPYKEELLIIDDFALPGKERVEKEQIAQKLDGLIAGIRHMPTMLGIEEQPKYLLGMSGGVDSCVVAALLTLAVGPEKVLGINMPSHLNSDATKNTARHTAQALDIAYEEIAINAIVRSVESTLGTDLTPVQRGNIHAKVRGTDILSNLAAKHGALFTNNGNKLEISLGYTTLYGDMNGAYALLGDLLKSEVFELGRYLNDTVFQQEVIPEILLPDELYRFKLPPKAELEKDQIDPMKFGYHDAMLAAMTDYQRKTPEDMLRWYQEGTLAENLGISEKLLERWNVTEPKAFVEDLEWFTTTVHRNIFKRVQAPPIIDLSKSAYGYDIRESILPWRPTRGYNRMKEQVLGGTA